jgi:hypothetical protein
MHTVLALVVPEVTVRIALVDYLAARASEKEMEKWPSEGGTEWSLTHGGFFFANIGGFVLRYPPSLPQADRSLSDSTTLSKEATSNQSGQACGHNGADDQRS